MRTDPGELARRAPQGRSALGVEKLTGCFVQYSAVVLCVIDIQADIDYFPVSGRLRFLLDHVVWLPRLGTRL